MTERDLNRVHYEYLFFLSAQAGNIKIVGNHKILRVSVRYVFPFAAVYFRANVFPCESVERVW